MKPRQFIIAVSLFFLGCIAVFLRTSRVHHLEHAGFHEPLLILNYSGLEDTNKIVSISLSSIEKVRCNGYKEVEIYKARGAIASGIVTEIQNLYRDSYSSSFSKFKPTINSIEYQLFMTINYNGGWSAARFKWNSGSNYVRISPENTSSSFRYVQVDLIPLEIRSCMSLLDRTRPRVFPR